jgi:hypothetical protein
MENTGGQLFKWTNLGFPPPFTRAIAPLATSFFRISRKRPFEPCRVRPDNSSVIKLRAQKI